VSQYPTPDPYSQPARPPVVRVSTPTVKPYATYILLAVTVFIYLLQVGTQYLLGTDLPFQLGAKYGPLIRLGEIWRLITPVFLHASLLHIGFNMYALVIYGRGLEARFGHGRFLLLYFLSAYAGNVLSFLLVPNPSLGASTAIFGLLAAEAIFLVKNRSLLGNRINATLLNLLFIAGYNLFIGFTSQGVDNFGHIGGLLGGLLFTWFGGPRWRVEGIYPMLSLVDEREGRGALAGTIAVLLFFIPLTALGWIWVVK